MTFEGILVNEYGEKLGYFFYCESTYTYGIKLFGATQYGYTLDGVYAYASRLGLQVW